jgi:hypothetical protein
VRVCKKSLKEYLLADAYFDWENVDNRARIFKLLRSPTIDSKEPILTAGIFNSLWGLGTEEE